MRLDFGDVHQFHVVEGALAHQGICQSVGGVQRGHGDNRALDSAAAHLYRVALRLSALLGGGDDVIDLVLIEQGEDVRLLLLDLADGVGPRSCSGSGLSAVPAVA